MHSYRDILKRCKEQGVDTSGCHIYIEPNNLDGELCLKGTLSHDKKWICIPTREYVPDFDDYVYVPKCYEIKDSYRTYVKGDSIWYLVSFYLLYEERVPA